MTERKTASKAIAIVFATVIVGLAAILLTACAEKPTYLISELQCLQDGVPEYAMNYSYDAEGNCTLKSTVSYYDNDSGETIKSQIINYGEKGLPQSVQFQDETGTYVFSLADFTASDNNLITGLAFESEFDFPVTTEYEYFDEHAISEIRQKNTFEGVSGKGVWHFDPNGSLTGCSWEDSHYSIEYSTAASEELLITPPGSTQAQSFDAERDDHGNITRIAARQESAEDVGWEWRFSYEEIEKPSQTAELFGKLDASIALMLMPL